MGLTRNIVHNQPGLKILVGTVTTNGSGAILSTNIPGGVFTATRNGVGDFTFTLDDVAAALLGINIGLYHQSGTDAGVSKYQVVAEAVGTTGAIQVKFYDHGSPPVVTDMLTSVLYVEILLDSIASD